MGRGLGGGPRGGCWWYQTRALCAVAFMRTTSRRKRGQYYGTVLGSAAAQKEWLSIAHTGLQSFVQTLTKACTIFTAVRWARGGGRRQPGGGGVKGASHQQPLRARPPAQCSSMVCVQPGALLLAVRHDSVESSGCINANRRC